MNENLHMIIVGTDPASRRGGIANALPGYFYALQQVGISYDFVPSHHATAWGGKWRYWLTSFVQIRKNLQAARSMDKKIVLYIHVGGGVVSFTRKFILALFFRAMKCPVVMQLHSAIVANSYLTTPTRRFLFHLAISPASAIGVLTPWWKNLLIATGTDKPLFVIPNPLDINWEMIARTPVNHVPHENKIVVLCMTRIEAGKGVDILIEALLHLPDTVQLVVAGDGSLLASIKEKATKLGLERRVIFTGWIEGEKKLSLLREADIFCLPSSNDSFGMVFIEAMVHGLPVIALDWGPIHDVIPNGKCGILIKQAEPKRLAHAIMNLAGDSNMRDRMGNNAQRWINERFSAQAVGKEIQKMMESVSL